MALNKKDRNKIIKEFIHIMDNYPDTMRIYTYNNNGGFSRDPTNKLCHSGAFLDEIESDKSDFKLVYALGFTCFSGTVASSWKIMSLNENTKFRIGFINGFKMKRALKRFKKYKRDKK